MCQTVWYCSPVNQMCQTVLIYFQSRGNNYVSCSRIKMYRCVMQERRITATNALYHPYLEDGRLRYHSCMCRCCNRDIDGRTIFSDDLEPCHPQPFISRFEKELVSMMRVRGQRAMNIHVADDTYSNQMVMNIHVADDACSNQRAMNILIPCLRICDSSMVFLFDHLRTKICCSKFTIYHCKYFLCIAGPQKHST